MNDIFYHRKMVALVHAEGTHSRWPDWDANKGKMPRRNEYESTGHYHWRMLHKNLGPAFHRSALAYTPTAPRPIQHSMPQLDTPVAPIRTTTQPAWCLAPNHVHLKWL